MTATEKKIINDLVNAALDKAEKNYKTVKPLIEQKEVMFSNENIETDIPGFPTINDGEPKVAPFIALVLDVRGSTKNLTQACSSCKVEFLERTLYESTAINTMGAFVINNRKGRITEFLGDGFLALFNTEKKTDVHVAHNASKECLEGLEIVNEILALRYNLPKLKVGIGLAYSKAIVMLINANNKFYPKALGVCVYRASKLATGYNEIYIDEALKYYWPTEKIGTLTFQSVDHKHKKDLDGFKIKKK